MTAEAVHSISKMQKIATNLKKKGKSIGFVPTMGYLHKGHLSLVDSSKKENDYTVVSIYVNPAQFSPNEDLDKYPRNLSQDIELLNNMMVDYVFLPTSKEVYPDGYRTYIVVEELENLLCGKSRKIHFRGVCTIVIKLINILQPDKIYLGEKDYQQYFIIKKMAEDLNLTTKIVPCLLVRDQDGLALSSRNAYLTKEERVQALSIYNSLKSAQTMFNKGIRNAEIIKREMSEILKKSGAIIDYISIVDESTLSEITTLNQKSRILLAVYIGKTRLIDNIKIP